MHMGFTSHQLGMQSIGMGPRVWTCLAIQVLFSQNIQWSRPFHSPSTPCRAEARSPGFRSKPKDSKERQTLIAQARAIEVDRGRGVIELW